MSKLESCKDCSNKKSDMSFEKNHFRKGMPPHNQKGHKTIVVAKSNWSLREHYSRDNTRTLLVGVCCSGRTYNEKTCLYPFKEGRYF